jgi:hypothetical protein
MINVSLPSNIASMISFWNLLKAVRQNSSARVAINIASEIRSEPCESTNFIHVCIYKSLRPVVHSFWVLVNFTATSSTEGLIAKENKGFRRVAVTTTTKFELFFFIITPDKLVSS